MKSLDEVIDWYENRKFRLIGRATLEEMNESILHYLKEYRDKLKESQPDDISDEQPMLPGME